MSQEQLQKLKEKHQDLTQVIGTLRDERNEVRQAIAEILCPFKIGDRIINRKGEKAEVAAIGHWNNLRYKTRIKKIGARGQTNQVITTAWESDQWKLDV